ncbi:conserved hypothetical protein [Lysobacter enzymogenes]|uniref:GtrA/DPMS transmembrane domain-containing protein n=2 Tax=Lysobacter enzymogenes TaxID=69 RepID=A0AAU9AVU2_LYSEN|nr:conserved hypothetical protein [Lysobacter enzymogenes]
MVQPPLRLVWLECAHARPRPVRRFPVPAPPPVARMSLTRQGRNFLIVGGIQYVVDWGVMVALSHLGMPVEAANLAGRVSGALLGFWLNGRFTFASAESSSLGRRQFARFIAMWLGTTVLSTGAISAVNAYAGLQWTWLAKPAIELVLAALSFTVSRYWVYRR